MKKMKLSLNKEVVSKLQNDELSNVRGGNEVNGFLSLWGASCKQTQCPNCPTGPEYPSCNNHTCVDLSLCLGDTCFC